MVSLESHKHTATVIRYETRVVNFESETCQISINKLSQTLLLYSSMKLPRASRNRLSGRILQFMLYTVHGASYLYISLRLPGGGSPVPTGMDIAHTTRNSRIT